MTATWIPSTSANVYSLSSANRPTTDIDGGALGRDPVNLAAGSLAVPPVIADPAFAVIEPSQPKWETPFLFGKWGSDSAAAPVTLTYSFYGTGSPAIAQGGGITPAALDDAHQNAVRTALAAYADVAQITFVEVAERANTIGHLRFIDDRALASSTFTAAYTSMPLMGSAQSGLVAFDVDRFNIVDDLSRGERVYATIVHELGHALGLTHPFDSDDTKAAVEDPRAVNGLWHKGWTVMSYYQPQTNLEPVGEVVNPIAPQIADVYVLQSFYGANRTTRTGDDAYQIDGKYPVAALWDAGGTDTLDASGAAGTSGLTLDLTPGQVGPHVAIAFGASIENAIGSAGNDTITGTNPGTLTAGDGTTTTTDGDNLLDGAAGNDTIFGLGGNDTLIGGTGFNLLDGGDGIDTASYTVASTAVTVARDGADLIVTTGTAIDHLRNIETLSFSDRSIATSDATTLIAPTPVTQTIDPHRRAAVTSNGTSRDIQMDNYSGPVAGLQNQFLGSDVSEAVRGSDNGDFINLLAGDDAADGSAGDDVLDGGLGSNFLTGGTGNDTFFVDGRSGGTTWSTATDLERGELVTAWGWQPGTSKLSWAEMSGADGFKGATAHIDLDNNGSIDLSMTFAGKTSGMLTTMTGTSGGSSYLAFTLT